MSYNESDFLKEDVAMPSRDERVLATLLYVSSFFTVFIGPLIIWMLKKEESSFIDYHGKEYFNFLISYSIYSFASIILNDRVNWDFNNMGSGYLRIRLYDYCCS